MLPELSQECGGTIHRGTDWTTRYQHIHKIKRIWQHVEDQCQQQQQFQSQKAELLLQYLDSQGSNDRLGVDQAGVTQVVQACMQNKESINIVGCSGVCLNLVQTAYVLTKI